MTRDHRNCLMHYLAPNLGAILILLLLLTGQIGAQEPASSTATTAGTMAPLTSSYQGTLTDAEGTPINGSVDMTARLYHEPVGGEAVWEEVRSGAAAVPVTNGLFHIQLGSVNPITMTLLSQPLWLGLSVDGDAEMSPREPLNTVPFAAVAGGLTTRTRTVSMQFGSDGIYEECTGKDVGDRRHLGYMIAFSPPGEEYGCWGRAVVRLPDDWKPGTDLRIAALAESDTAQTVTPRFYYGAVSAGALDWEVRGQNGPQVSVEPTGSDITLLTIPAERVAQGDTVVLAIKFLELTDVVAITGVYLEYTAGQ
jgi:hypothetical protein